MNESIPQQQQQAPPFVSRSRSGSGGGGGGGSNRPLSSVTSTPTTLDTNHSHSNSGGGGGTSASSTTTPTTTTTTTTSGGGGRGSGRGSSPSGGRGSSGGGRGGGGGRGRGGSRNSGGTGGGRGGRHNHNQSNTRGGPNTDAAATTSTTASHIHNNNNNNNNHDNDAISVVSTTSTATTQTARGSGRNSGGRHAPKSPGRGSGGRRNTNTRPNHNPATVAAAAAATTTDSVVIASPNGTGAADTETTPTTTTTTTASPSNNNNNNNSHRRPPKGSSSNSRDSGRHNTRGRGGRESGGRESGGGRGGRHGGRHSHNNNNNHHHPHRTSHATTGAITIEPVPSMSEQQLSTAIATLFNNNNHSTTTTNVANSTIMTNTTKSDTQHLKDLLSIPHNHHHLPPAQLNTAADVLQLPSSTLVSSSSSSNTTATANAAASLHSQSPNVVVVPHLNLPTPAALFNVTNNSSNSGSGPHHKKNTVGVPMIISRHTFQNMTTAAKSNNNNNTNNASSSLPAATVPSSNNSSTSNNNNNNSNSHHIASSSLQSQSQDEYESHTQHLSELLAEAALFEDDDEDDDNHDRKHKAGSSSSMAKAAPSTTTIPGGLLLPPVPPVSQFGVLVSGMSNRTNNGNVYSTNTPATNHEVISGVAPAAASTTAPVKREKKKKPPKKKKVVVDETADNTDEAKILEPVAPVTTTEALKALPAQEVSISATTQVKILRNESSLSLSKDDVSPLAKSQASDKKTKSTGKNQGGGKKGLTDDVKANRSAARRFNNEVRTCVENSDPDGVYALLHDRHNHKFALDASVLELVMKAYVMAAMFDDALYCLRNCAVPSTLSTIQTERILACMPQNLRSGNAYTAADMINQLCVNTIFDTATARTYFLRIVRGIALEFLEEAMSARDRICSAPCERLVRAGTCVVDARLERGKKASDLIVIPGDQLGVWQADTLENRGIQAGDAVSILPYAGPYPMSAESLDRNMIEATITNTNPMVLRLQDKANAKLHNMLTEKIEGNVFRVDKLANRMGFNRQLSAAVAIASPIGDTTSVNYVRDVRRPCPEIIHAVTAMNENFEQFVKESGPASSATSSTRPKSTTLTSTAALCATAVPWNIEDEVKGIDQDSIIATSRLALEKYGALEGLNESQQLAVECATTNRLTLVQGPPGTGKTRIAICILEHWGRLALAAAEKGEDPAPILATSDSNIAVDNLVEGCSAVGLRVVRLGRPEAIRPELLRYCIDRPPSSYDANRNNGNGMDGTSGNGGNAYKERMKQLKNAQIICCTCIGSGGDILDSLGPFERVLVDEATQATEPAVLVPLMRGCRQLVLVGDHCQLPPTVLSTRAEEEGHGVPLFSRMVACGVPPHMLDTQYRMHPGIAMFPSDLFYGGLLKNGVSAPERRPLAGFPWPREEFPVAFIPVKGIEMDDGVSKYNEEEAKNACQVVELLLSGGQCSVSDIAVVTPYAAQARLIRRMTRRMTGNSGPPYIEVSSVDGFQGREKEAVVFSAVRSNDYGAIGFTSDWRRINVSFTRARRALVVIGNEVTLRRGDPETWMPWLAWADAHGVNVEKPGIARGRYEPEQLRRVRGGTTAAEMLKDVLARQQAQLKQAEHQQERAVKNSAGHIIGNEEVEDGVAAAPGITLEEDLALLQNADGNWDDSDDDEDNNKKVLAHSGSRITLASGASSNDVRSGDDSNGPLDAWDL